VGLVVTGPTQPAGEHDRRQAVPRRANDGEQLIGIRAASLSRLMTARRGWLSFLSIDLMRNIIILVTLPFFGRAMGAAIFLLFLHNSAQGQPREPCAYLPPIRGISRIEVAKRFISRARITRMIFKIPVPS
jgi:hypothetical protein